MEGTTGLQFLETPRPVRTANGVPSQGPTGPVKSTERRRRRAAIRAFLKRNGQPAGARRQGGGLR